MMTFQRVPLGPMRKSAETALFALVLAVSVPFVSSSCLDPASGGSPGYNFFINIPDPVPPATAGQSYQITLWAISSLSSPRSSVYEWIIGGSVPPGLSFCGRDTRETILGQTCVILGTPTTLGEYRMNVTVIGYKQGKETDRATLSNGLTIVVVSLP
jgi:hypothetical protein